MSILDILLMSPLQSKRGDFWVSRGGKKKKLNTYMTLFVKSHQGAAVKSPERSVRQLIWVFAGLLLYTPLEVRSCAYNHAIATVKSTANLSHIGLFDFKNWGRYCKSINQQQTWRLKSNKNHNHQTSNDRDTHTFIKHIYLALHSILWWEGMDLN